MNDPNGLIRHRDRYHAFYQHNPHADVWGPMHWRHASSADLLEWQDHGIALAPDHLGAIFSGSIVFDDGNTSGLARPGEPDPLVAVFTHHGDDGRESQSLAHSIDHGATWTSYAGNPVLTGDGPDFRDPKVFRYHDGPGRAWWVMAVAAGDRVAFYRSDDLRTWASSSSHSGHLVAEGGTWECPDLVLLDPDHRAGWVLLVSIASPDPEEPGQMGPSRVLAVPGHFDGAAFRAAGPAQPLDRGPDFYAAQSFAGMAGEPTVMAWMNSWRYARTHPSRGRRGLLSIPRRLRLGPDGAVAQRLRWAHAGQPVAAGAVLASQRQVAFDLLVDEGTVVVTGSDGDTGEAGVRVAIGADRIALDRHVPGHPLLGWSRSITRQNREPVRLLVDHGTVEVFADGGTTVASMLVFAGADWRVSLDAPATVDRLRTGAR